MLNHNEMQWLEFLMGEYGLHHRIDTPGLLKSRTVLTALRGHGYVHDFLEEGFSLSERAAEDYPGLLKNGPFGSAGASDDAEKRAREESSVQIPKYRWNPDPGPDGAHHVACLAASMRDLDETGWLRGTWPGWLHEQAKAFKGIPISDSHFMTNDRISAAHPDGYTAHALAAHDSARSHVASLSGDLQKPWTLPDGKESEIRLNADVVHYLMSQVTDYHKLPQRAFLMAASAVEFAEPLSKYSYSAVLSGMSLRNGGVEEWDEELAFGRIGREDRRVDAARWMFHNFHCIEGAADKPAYLETRNNPFRLDRVDCRTGEELPARFKIYLHPKLSEIVEDSFLSWYYDDDQPTLTRHQQAYLTQALDESFSALPPEDQEIVRTWHEANDGHPAVWNGSWRPPAHAECGDLRDRDLTQRVIAFPGEEVSLCRARLGGVHVASLADAAALTPGAATDTRRTHAPADPSPTHPVSIPAAREPRQAR
ncbi:hypothetical protein ACFV2D_36895 [Streptomyces capillispiralis]|uniref:hypothetical protein n=1 Tax=Streptomyces capillispiralis TaxID=68182 RepID=UPI0036BB6E27